MVAFTKAFASPRKGCTPKTHTPWGQVQLSGLRYYSPELGRWVNRDPIGERGGKNDYVFVQNAACVRIDPFGLWPTWGGLPTSCCCCCADGIDVEIEKLGGPPGNYIGHKFDVTLYPKYVKADRGSYNQPCSLEWKEVHSWYNLAGRLVAQRTVDGPSPLIDTFSPWYEYLKDHTKGGPPCPGSDFPIVIADTPYITMDYAPLRRVLDIEITFESGPNCGCDGPRRITRKYRQALRYGAPEVDAHEEWEMDQVVN